MNTKGILGIRLRKSESHKWKHCLLIPMKFRTNNQRHDRLMSTYCMSNIGLITVFSVFFLKRHLPIPYSVHHLLFPSLSAFSAIRLHSIFPQSYYHVHKSLIQKVGRYINVLSKKPTLSIILLMGRTNSKRLRHKI